MEDGTGTRPEEFRRNEQKANEKKECVKMKVQLRLVLVAFFACVLLVALGCRNNPTTTEEGPAAAPGEPGVEGEPQPMVSPPPTMPEEGCAAVFFGEENREVGDNAVEITISLTGDMDLTDGGKLAVDVFQTSTGSAPKPVFGVICAPAKSVTFKVPAGLGEGRIAAFYVPADGGPSLKCPAAVVGPVSLDSKIEGIEFKLVEGADFGDLTENYSNIELKHLEGNPQVEAPGAPAENK